MFGELMKNVLIIGSGAREHAIADAFKRSKGIGKIYVSPGNDGIKKDFECFSTEVTDADKPFAELIEQIKEKKIDYVFVGNEQALSDGIADELENAGIPVVGPSQKAAMIESSKVFSKFIMKKYHVPTADYQVFTAHKEALEYLNNAHYPVVVKADGLAAGKGVIIASDFAEASEALKLIFLDKKFGSAGNQVIIETFLKGEEASIFAFSDGQHFVSTIFAQDHKAIYDGDKGSNTGGMGAFAPVDKFSHLKEKVDREIFKPVLDGMKAEGTPFKGVLFAGLMIDKDEINVIEFNCRLGDPETEVILPLMKTDFALLCEAIIQKQIDQIELEFINQYAVTVVSASSGYPESFEKGNPITINQTIENYQGQIFYAGVKQSGDYLVNNGGRVLCATALADTLKQAIDTAYQMTACISFSNRYYRKDIGQKGLEKK